MYSSVFFRVRASFVFNWLFSVFEENASIFCLI